MKKLITSLFVIPLLIVLLVTFILATEPGLRLLTKGCAYTNGIVLINKVEGSISDSFILSGIKIKTSLVDIEIDHIVFSWTPSKLFRGILQVSELSFTGISVYEKKNSQQVETAPSQQTFQLPEFLLPLAIVVKKFRIDDIGFWDKAGEWARINSFELVIKTDTEHITIEKLNFDAPQLGLITQGSIVTGNGWPITLKGAWRLNFEGYSEMGGQLSASGPIGKLDVEFAATRPVNLALTGVLENLLNDPSWNATINSGKGLLSAVNSGWPDIDLDNLRAIAHGDFGNYAGVVNGSASWWKVEDVNIETELVGNLEGIIFNYVDLKYNDSEANVTGEIGWRDRFFWDAKAEAKRLNPKDFSIDFPGNINTNLTSEGKVGYEEQGLDSSYNIQSLDGTLRGYTVEGHGTALVDEHGAEVQAFYLSTGESILKISGIAKKIIDISFDIQSPNIGQILPDASGNLEIVGTISGDYGTPNLHVDMQAADLQYSDITAELIQGPITMDFSEGGTLSTNIVANNINVGTLELSHTKIDVKGFMENHDLILSVNSNLGNVGLNATGGWGDKNWSGNLTFLDSEIPGYGDWQVKDEAKIIASNLNVSIENLCLLNTHGEVCGSADWQKSGKWTTNVFTERFDLQYLYNTLGLPYPITGELTLSAKGEGDAESLSNGAIQVDINDSSLAVPIYDDHEEGDEKHIIRWSTNSISASLEEKLLMLKLDSTLIGGSFIKAIFVGIDVGGFADDYLKKDISGDIAFSFADLADLAFLSSYTVKPTGGFDGDLSLSGVLEDPIVKGTINLSDASCSIPSLGVTLEDAQLRLQADKGGADMNFSVHSGDGNVEGEGRIFYGEESGFLGQLNIKGSAFEAVKLPEYEVIVDPDLHFVFNNKRGKLSGSITIPKAIIAPENLNGSVSESKDVIYVNVEEETEATDWPMYINIDIGMGEDVLVDGVGLYGYLDGAFEVIDKPGFPIIGSGQLALRDGSFSIYGRSLKIERGRVFFPGGPIENPSLDVRAQRSVDERQAGSSGGWTVGVDVSGSVDDLHFELFSTPSMDDSDILAYMVVGTSASDSSSEDDGLLKSAASALGIGATADFIGDIGGIVSLDDMHIEGGSSTEDASIVMGKNLTKDLYLGYDYNFFQSKSQFIFRYALGKGFYIQTQNSTEANGADLFYSFER